MAKTHQCRLLPHYPFGSCISSRSFSSAAYRYGFNGKEEETDGTADNYDFGARIYDGRLGRWLAVDRLHHKNPNLSVYSTMANSPIYIVDPDGNENIIYLIVLPSAMKVNGGKFSVQDINQMVKESNDEFRRLGLETRVTVFNKTIHEKHFDVTKIAKTDAVAVLGSDAATLEYITQHDPTSGAWFKSTGWGVNPNSQSPEKSENPGIVDKVPTDDDDWIAINTDYIGNWANADVTKPAGDGSLPISKASYASLSLVHGAGHTAGLDHKYDINKNPQTGATTSELMLDGDDMIGRFYSNYRNAGILPEAVLSSIKSQTQNRDYTITIKTRYGDQCPTDEKPITIRN